MGAVIGSVLLDLAAPAAYNPFKPMLFISYYLPDSEPGHPRYAKGLLVCSHIASPGHENIYRAYLGSLIYWVLRYSIFFRPPVLHPQTPSPSGAKTWHQEAREIGPVC